MDFDWAVEQMKQGKKVKRECWEKGYSLWMDSYGAKHFHNSKGSYFNPILEEFEATDWKPHNKPFNLSKKSFITTIVNDTHNLTTTCYTEEDIEEFIKVLKEKILKDGNDMKSPMDTIGTIDKLAGERFG